MQLTKLTTIPPGKSIPINTLGKPRLVELQSALAWLGYPVGDLDGALVQRPAMLGARRLLTSRWVAPNLIDAIYVAKLQGALDKTKPSKARDFATEQGTIAAIKSECTKQGLGLKPQIAYVLATAEWGDQPHVQAGQRSLLDS